MNDSKANKVTLGITPYLFFGGRCQEALDFYRTAVAAEVERVLRFDESPEPIPAGMLQPDFEHKVMHSAFRINGSLILASDGMGTSDKSAFKGFSLTLSVATEAEADRAFNALADGGSVQMALGKTFWSPRYGMLVDRFGVHWMVMVPASM
jgi:PhnB protein